MAVAGLAAGASNLQAQGTVNFSNIGGAPVTDAFGVRLPSTGYMVALYYAPEGETDPGFFMQVGASTGFLGSGLFLGGTRTAPVSPPGGVANFQVRAWSTQFGATTYEEALSQGFTDVGSSAIVTVKTGNPLNIPPDLPANLVVAGLQGFCVGGLGCVPEPGMLSLLSLPGAMLLLVWVRQRGLPK